MSPAAAVVVGTLVVNVPVLAFIVGGVPLSSRFGLSVTPALFLSAIAGWVWWSFWIPKWRLWAYRRVASTGELQRFALRSGLVWPKGSRFERTEIKSPEHRRLESELEQQRP
jgi:hypothetical protein